jgi:arylsulfatase
MGGITELATSAPGYTSIRPNTAAPLAETLKLNGYSTAQFGKCHKVPVWETSPMGPFDAWPSRGGGFEHFYGFLGGETNQYAPAIYEDTVPVEPDRTPEEGYHFTEDMTERAIDWVGQQKALMPDKPFFMYYAPGATHAPHHVPTEWSDKYKGKFDQGWDRLRQETLARQKDLGVIPEDAELTARPEEIPAWDEINVTGDARANLNTRKVLEPRVKHQERMRDVLAAGWEQGDKQCRKRLLYRPPYWAFNGAR